MSASPIRKFYRLNILTYGQYVVWITTSGTNIYKPFAGELDYRSYEGYPTFEINNALKSLNLAIINHSTFQLVKPDPVLYQTLKFYRAKCLVLQRTTAILHYMMQRHAVLEDPYTIDWYTKIVEGTTNDLRILDQFEPDVTNLDLKKKLLKFKIDEHKKVILLVGDIRERLHNDLRHAKSYEDVDSAFRLMCIKTRSQNITLDELMFGKAHA